MISEKTAERVIWGGLETAATEAVGGAALWGASPAVDLVQGVGAGEGPVKVLLAEPGDVRHVLRTIAARTTTRPIHFYVQEDSVELIARHLALLRVAMDWEVPLKQRTAAFLELFGNTLVTEKMEAYVGRVGAELCAEACGEDGDEDALADLSLLKFRDRDTLAKAFGWWGALASPSDSFRVEALWEHRLRARLTTRYDARQAAFDWDYRHNLLAGAEEDPATATASVIHVKEYREWRERGVAFEFGDKTYDRPNRTMATFAEGLMKQGKARGEKRQVRGYWGDMTMSPYPAVGIEASHAPLFEIVDKGTGTERRRHNATEVATFNVLSDLYQIETATPYAPKSAHQIFSGLSTAAAAATTTTRSESHADEAGKDETSADESSWRRDALRRAEHIVAALDGVKFVPVVGDLETCVRKLKQARHVGHIDVLYTSMRAAHALASDDLATLLGPNALIVAETAKFCAPLDKAQKAIFAQKLHAMATAKGHTPLYATTKAPKHDNAKVVDLIGDCETAPRQTGAFHLRFVAKKAAETPPPPPPGAGRE